MQGDAGRPGAQDQAWQKRAGVLNGRTSRGQMDKPASGTQGHLRLKES